MGWFVSAVLAVAVVYLWWLNLSEAGRADRDVERHIRLVTGLDKAETADWFGKLLPGRLAAWKAKRKRRTL